MRWNSQISAGIGLILGAFAIAQTRSSLSATFAASKETSDSYALPSPERAIAFSLGYRSAWADLLFADVLVSYGLHFQYKRRFEFVGDYLDVINALDPKYAAPYRIADTLLVLQPVPARLEDYRRARTILERGMAELPRDTDLWLTAGQYLAYLAPPLLKDEKEKREFRLEGARRLARACELTGSNENVPYNCIAAAGLFSRAGQNEASEQFLEKMLAITDDPQLREMVLRNLSTLRGEKGVELRFQKFRELWGNDLSFIPKDLFIVLGPPFKPAECAGANSNCVTSWRAWGERTNSARDSAR